MAEIGAAISGSERRATVAERDATDGFATRFLAERVGASFPARVSGVTRFGLFVELADSGAQGLIPMRDFAEYMDHDEPHQRLVGSRSGRAIQLGETLEVEN
jgi:ribonuclease R